MSDSQDNKLALALADMGKNAKIITKIIDEEVAVMIAEGRTELSDEDMARIHKRVAPHRKTFTEYDL